jgi:hypothetical protein
MDRPVGRTWWRPRTDSGSAASVEAADTATFQPPTMRYVVLLDVDRSSGPFESAS